MPGAARTVLIGGGSSIVVDIFSSVGADFVSIVLESVVGAGVVSVGAEEVGLAGEVPFICGAAFSLVAAVGGSAFSVVVVVGSVAAAGAGAGGSAASYVSQHSTLNHSCPPTCCLISLPTLSSHSISNSIRLRLLIRNSGDGTALGRVSSIDRRDRRRHVPVARTQLFRLFQIIVRARSRSRSSSST